MELLSVRAMNFQDAILAMRNPTKSWDMSDSYWTEFEDSEFADSIVTPYYYVNGRVFQIGEKDHELAMKLVTNGASHRKFMRQIPVSMVIKGPGYWWRQMATYKVGTTFNSTSQMHTGVKGFYTKDDFADISEEKLNRLNRLVEAFKKTRKTRIKKQLYKEMPYSYLYRRTITLNYEVLRNIYFDRKSHVLDEWTTFCKWIEKFPYSEFLTTEEG